MTLEEREKNRAIATALSAQAAAAEAFAVIAKRPGAAFLPFADRKRAEDMAAYARSLRRRIAVLQRADAG